MARFVIGSSLMNRPTTEDDLPARVVRAAETQFLVERYHRAFEDEAEYLRGLVKVWIAREIRSLEARSVEMALETMCAALAEHVSLQEIVIFPVFERNGHCSEPLNERGTADCAALFGAIEGLREVCAVDPGERPCSTDARLRVRLVHLANEIQQHLRDELRLLLPDGLSDNHASTTSMSMSMSMSASASAATGGAMHAAGEAIHLRQHRPAHTAPHRVGRRLDGDGAAVRS
jgi:iron-sulfur cluster repair protein YtfE (RIC family)